MQVRRQVVERLRAFWFVPMAAGISGGRQERHMRVLHRAWL